MARINNVIAIVSPKGGVGKTVTTANLATALATLHDRKVLAIDTNVSTASLGLHLDIFYPGKTINELAKKGSHDDSIHIYHENLHVIPASIKIKKKDKNLKKMRQNMHQTIKNYEKVIKKLSKKYDIVLLDCSPGFDLETIAAMHIAGGVIVVTNPDYPSIVTAAKAIEYAKLLKMPVGGIVLNKVRNKRYELKSEDIESALKVKVIQKVPYDKHIPRSISKKQPVVSFKKNSKSGKSFRKLAEMVTGEKEPSTFHRIKKKFKRKRNK